MTSGCGGPKSPVELLLTTTLMITCVHVACKVMLVRAEPTSAYSNSSCLYMMGTQDLQSLRCCLSVFARCCCCYACKHAAITVVTGLHTILSAAAVCYTLLCTHTDWFCVSSISRVNLMLCLEACCSGSLAAKLLHALVLQSAAMLSYLCFCTNNLYKQSVFVSVFIGQGATMLACNNAQMRPVSMGHLTHCQC